MDNAVATIIPAAERTATYVPYLKGKKVGLIVNQTSRIGDQHLVDTLLKLGTNIVKVYAPEHGFRGEADAGEKISNTIDKNTNLPILSLYGSRKKPSKEDLAGVDLLVFDIQDVGARFYTYISTLHYVMEAAAEQNIPLILLDRPNPNGYFIDGPVLDPKFKSFVGMHPVPTIYGMTIGEYAQMINGELWLDKGVQCNLTVIPCNNYKHDSYYELPVKPSPNLPDMRSILLYPSTCFFEGTTLSLGRGTPSPFQWIGHPKLKADFRFTPISTPGAKDPPQRDQLCYGTDLSMRTLGSIMKPQQIELSLLIRYHKELTAIDEKYFLDNNFIDKLAGTDQLRLQINEGKTESQIRKTWEEGLADFRIIRKKYLIYE